MFDYDEVGHDNLLYGKLRCPNDLCIIRSKFNRKIMKKSENIMRKMNG